MIGEFCGQACLGPPDFTANPTAQSDRNLSPLKVSPKTGISAFEAGDFQQILAKVADFRSLEISEIYANTPQIAGISRKH